MKIGDYRLIPKGTQFWSIALQENVAIDNDAIVEITNTVIGNNNYFFGRLQILLFNIPGYIPTLITKAHGDVGVSFDKTKPYEIPKPVFWNPIYK